MSIFDLAYGNGLRMPGTLGASALTAPTAAPTTRPRSSKIVELLEALQEERGAPIPATYRDLPEEERRRIRRQNLLGVGAAIGNAEPGKLGSALLEAAMAQNEAQQRGVQEYSERLRSQRRDRRLAIGDELELEQARMAEEDRLLRQEAQDAERDRLRAVAEQLRQQLDDPNDPRIVEAQMLAASGDQGGLIKLSGQIRESKARRQLAQELGVDPDDERALEDALNRREEEELKRRGLEKYYQAPERPRSGTHFVGADGFHYLGDPVTGRAILFRDASGRPIRSKEASGGGVSEDEQRETDYKAAIDHAEWKRAQLMDTYQTELAKGKDAWPFDPNTGHKVPPTLQPIDFPAEVKARFEQLQRVRTALKPSRQVSPVEGTSDPQAAPTGPTGAGKGKPTESGPTIEDVLRRIPAGVIVDAAARTEIAADLKARKSVTQILREMADATDNQTAKNRLLRAAGLL